MGASTYEALAQMAAQNIINVLNSEEPVSSINKM